MHWTAVSAARAASRAAELAAKVTSAQDVLPISDVDAKHRQDSCGEYNCLIQ